jgi:hypothetical protein
MTRAGARLRFEELRLLRSLVHRAQGAVLPSHSAESLAEFLQRVWQRRGEIVRAGGGGGQPAVYRLYSTATEANPLTRSAQTYLDEVAAVARPERSRPCRAPVSRSWSWPPTVA